MNVQALVLCPTRELADQVTAEIRRLARALDNIKVITLCGGVALRAQTQSLLHGAHVVVGTPGRILDHIDRGALHLGAVETLVLDEADRMLDMGFFEDMARVIKHCARERQTLLFSATYPEGIDKRHNGKRDDASGGTMAQAIDWGRPGGGSQGSWRNAGHHPRHSAG